MFNDEWMRERGFLDEKIKVASDLIKGRINESLITARTEELVSHAIDRMRQFDISQIPVMDSNGFVGSVDESDVFKLYFEDKNIADKPIKEVMRTAFPIVKMNTPIYNISKLINKDNKAVLVDLENGKFQIITKYDVINMIG
jgi:cystathionine beta-synthase